jgi:HK97 family phage major capsid protein
MTIKELREKIAEIKKRADELLETVMTREENRGRFTGEEEERLNKMLEDMREHGKVLEAMEEKEKRDLAFAQPANPPPPVAGAGDNAGDGQGAERSAAGFRDFGHFVQELRWGGPVIAEYRELSMGVAAEGGLLVPDRWRDEILMIQPEEEVVMPFATVIPAGSPPDAKEHFPALTQGANGVLGGLAFAWIAEGGLKPETDYDLEDADLEPREYACHVVISDKLLRNSEAAGDFLRRMLNLGVAQNRDLALVKGDGVGKPLGVLHATNPAVIDVNRAAANLIDLDDVVGMFSALLASSYSSARWIAHQTTLPQLITIADAAGNSIWIQGNAAKGIPPTLFGVPVKITGRSFALGARGDLALCDLSYYLVKLGSGPFVDASPHVHFTTNKTVVKAFGNIDGQSWLSAPLTLDDGATQASPFVVLDVP